jgi:hypothetical protein
MYHPEAALALKRKHLSGEEYVSGERMSLQRLHFRDLGSALTIRKRALAFGNFGSPVTDLPAVPNPTPVLLNSISL